jgi:uncharacterized protein YecT (DUF1311 family)
MRSPLPILLLLGALVPLLPQRAHAAELCSETLSTAAQTQCLLAALKDRDRELDQALARVAQEAQQVPGPTFQTLWRENLKGFYRTTVDPHQQAEAFRAQRRAVCAYAKSVGFQGTGYGISTTRCELALTQALLQELRP